MKLFLIRGWEPIIPGVCWLFVRPPANQRSASGAGVSTPFSSSGCRSCRCMEVFLIRGWYPILPGCAGLILEPQPISDRPAGLGFPHRAGQFRPGISPFSSPGCRSCRCMEGCLNLGWEPILPGCDEIVGFPRGATPAACSSPPHWPRAGGGALGQWDSGSENAGIKVICLLYYISLIVQAARSCPATPLHPRRRKNTQRRKICVGYIYVHEFLR